jgi:hypothetical protein
MESGGIDPHILNLGTKWRRLVGFALLPFYRGEKGLGKRIIGSWVGL